MSDAMSAACDCKIGRDAEAYGLDALNADLRRRREDGASLRSLARYVNVRLLKAELLKADADIVGDAESVYDALEGDDVAPERRADVRDQLSYAGVNLAALYDDFVSHQTVRAHLNDCLGLDTSRPGVTTIKEARDLIAWASDKEERTIKQTLAQLDRNGTLDLGDMEVTLSVTVRCADCGDSFRVSEILECRRCSCCAAE